MGTFLGGVDESATGSLNLLPGRCCVLREFPHDSVAHPRREAADTDSVGIEQASARVREINGMVSALQGRAAAPAAATDSAAFAATLQRSMLAAGGQPTTTFAPLPASADVLAQLQGGTNALGMQAMLAGAVPSGHPVAAPSRLTGDLTGLDPGLRASLEQVASGMGRTLDVVSGLRTRAEQEHLYQKYLAGTGNLAAVPGTSRHESGMAADVYVDGVALADVPGGREAAARAGLGFPVPGEAWHVEPTR